MGSESLKSQPGCSPCILGEQPSCANTTLRTDPLSLYSGASIPSYSRDVVMIQLS